MVRDGILEICEERKGKRREKKGRQGKERGGSLEEGASCGIVGLYCISSWLYPYLPTSLAPSLFHSSSYIIPIRSPRLPVFHASSTPSWPSALSSMYSISVPGRYSISSISVVDISTPDLHLDTVQYILLDGVTASETFSCRML